MFPTLLSFAIAGCIPLSIRFGVLLLLLQADADLLHRRNLPPHPLRQRLGESDAHEATHRCSSGDDHPGN